MNHRRWLVGFVGAACTGLVLLAGILGRMVIERESGDEAASPTVATSVPAGAGGGSVLASPTTVSRSATPTATAASPRAPAPVDPVPLSQPVLPVLRDIAAVSFPSHVDLFFYQHTCRACDVGPGVLGRARLISDTVTVVTTWPDRSQTPLSITSPPPVFVSDEATYLVTCASGPCLYAYGKEGASATALHVTHDGGISWTSMGERPGVWIPFGFTPNGELFGVGQGFIRWGETTPFTLARPSRSDSRHVGAGWASDSAGEYTDAFGVRRFAVSTLDPRGGAWVIRDIAESEDGRFAITWWNGRSVVSIFDQQAVHIRSWDVSGSACAGALAGWVDSRRLMFVVPDSREPSVARAFPMLADIEAGTCAATKGAGIPVLNLLYPAGLAPSR